MRRSVRLARKIYLVPVVYLVVSAAWILATDSIVDHFAGQFSDLAARNISIIKRLAFVAATTVFLTVLMHKYVRMILRSNLNMRRVLCKMNQVSRIYKHNANELDAILNNSLVGMAFVDGDMVIRRVNRNFCDIMEFPTDYFVGVDVTSGNDKCMLCSRILEIIAECRDRNRPAEVEFEAAFPGGGRKWLQMSITRIKPVGNMNGFVVVLRDITLRKEHEERIVYLSLHDCLTGLPNRRFFNERLEETCGVARRYGESFSVLFMDINDFKMCNDRHGHEFGDAVLKEFAGIAGGTLRESDVLARIGGDEFAAIVRGVDDRPVCEYIAGKLRARLAEVTEIAGVAVTLSASIGYAVFPEDGQGVDALLSAADRSMYAQKDMYRESRRREGEARDAGEEMPDVAVA